MSNITPLQKKPIAVVVENQFIPSELQAYRNVFRKNETEIHFVSRLWDQPEQTFIQTIEKSDYDNQTFGNKRINEIETVTATYDVQRIRPEDYAAILMSANYTSVRCRYYDASRGETPQQTPVVQFIAQAMQDKKIVKGFLCHALWILTPVWDLLVGRKVICHEVVRADIENAGGIYTESETGIVVDDDIVTGKTGHHASLFAETILSEIQNRY